MANSLNQLRKVVDLVGPGLWLELDKAAFPAVFGGEIGNESAEVEAARFAGANGCCFVSDGKTAKFGRAYYASAIV